MPTSIANLFSIIACMKPTLLFDHDGGVDDLLSLLLVLTMDEIDLLGVVITPADCYPSYAVEASRKIIDLLGQPHIPVAESNVRGINAFPAEWRSSPQIINALPQLLNVADIRSPFSPQSGIDFVISTLEAASEPVTYLMTGPCTTLVAALQKRPTLREKIKEVVWMAGAVDVPGNVAMHTHDGTAEWNVYWDAVSARWLLEQNLPLVLFSLDITNHVPVGMNFLRRLARQAHNEVSNLASVAWAITVNAIPSYEYLYHMWDVMATSYVSRPDLFTAEKVALTIATSPPNEGQTQRSVDSGHWVHMIQTADVDDFYEYVLHQFQRNFVE